MPLRALTSAFTSGRMAGAEPAAAAAAAMSCCVGVAPGGVVAWFCASAAEPAKAAAIRAASGMGLRFIDVLRDVPFGRKGHRRQRVRPGPQRVARTGDRVLQEVARQWKNAAISS